MRFSWPWVAVTIYCALHAALLIALPWMGATTNSVSPCVEVAWLILAFPANWIVFFSDEHGTRYVLTLIAGALEWYYLALCIETLIVSFFRREKSSESVPGFFDGLFRLRFSRHILPLLFVLLHQLPLFFLSNLAVETGLNDAFERNGYWGVIGFPYSILALVIAEVSFHGPHFFLAVNILTLFFGYLQWYVFSRVMIWAYSRLRVYLRRVTPPR